MFVLMQVILRAAVMTAISIFADVSLPFALLDCGTSVEWITVA
jgi:hypothetical protein